MPDYQRALAQRLRPERFQHSERVAETARKLALQHGLDPGRAYRAGLLHDYARDLPDKELVRLARVKGISIHPVEASLPKLLHAPLGAVLVQEELGVTDRELVAAVASHTVGAPGMSPLAAIVYLADMVESGRNFPGVESLRALALLNLYGALLQAFNQSLYCVIAGGGLIHPVTVEARNDLLFRCVGEGKDY